MTLSEFTEAAALWQLLNPPPQEMMSLPVFNLLSNADYKQRWDFRNRDGDSSSDDGKSESGAKLTHEKHRLVPGLVPPENDETTPECQEETTNPEKGCGIVTPNPKEASRRCRKDKVVKEKTVIGKSDVDRGCKKRKHIVHDAGLIDDLRKFRESLVEELRIERENLVGWMKDEMSEKAGNKRVCTDLDKKEANHVDKNLSLQNRRPEGRNKSTGDAKKIRSRQPGKTSRRKNPDTVSCSQPVAKDIGEPSKTVDMSKFPFMPLDRNLHLQQNNLSHTTPLSTAFIEKVGGGSLELLYNMNHGSSHQSCQVLGPNFPALPCIENHLLESSSVNLSSRNSGRKLDSDEIPGYYNLLLQEAERSGYSSLMEPKDKKSILQTMFPNSLHRDTARNFSSTSANTNPMPSQNPPGKEENVLGVRLNGGTMNFIGFGNNYA